ncbi:MAG TPA: type IV pilus secretin PilQ [Pyrinomonadaceae bacterium]|nr:type IV pilus secretin PilQ [Pyrinomonadaceae bacterium]
MNSLQITRGYALKAIIALMIVSTLCLAVTAQRTDPQRQGRQYGDPGFRGEPINLNVVNADIRDILNYITEQYGINFVIDKSVAAVPVTVNVSEVPWNVALDSILRSQDLGAQVNGTILRIASAKTLATEGETYRLQMDNQLDTSALVTEFIRLNYARAKGNLVRGTSTAGTTTAGAASYGSLIPVGLTQSTAGGAGASSGAAAPSGTGLLPIIQRRLSRRGSIEVDERSNSLIITDVRQNIDAIKQLIAILDQPEPQVEIEARIVAATRNFSRNLGAELSAIVTGPGGKAATFDTFNQAQNFNTILGLTTGIFGTARIDLAITAGETKGQVKVIATPRVTALNNQQAKIESGTKIPIQTIQPTGGDAIATTTYVDVPLKLEITPQITDVGTVVLDVLAENASIAPSVGSQAPAINNQKMETQVVVPDGGTTVVGGVLFDDERENQSRTPGLSKIPLLGNLFKRKGVQRDTVEILFFITPRIMRPDFATTGGQSGVKTSGTVVQPVPLGNPPSNSTTPTQDQGAPATRPEAQPAAPVKP